MFKVSRKWYDRFLKFRFRFVYKYQCPRIFGKYPCEFGLVDCHDCD